MPEEKEQSQTDKDDPSKPDRDQGQKFLGDGDGNIFFPDKLDQAQQSAVASREKLTKI